MDITSQDLWHFSHDALKKIGQDNLAESFSIAWNPRMRSTAGRAMLNTLKIEMNPRLLEISHEEVYRTVLHELAHLVAWKRDGERGHGTAWRAACTELGIPGEKSTHSLPLPVRKQRKQWRYKCTHCGEAFDRVRRIKAESACHHCCKKYNKNRFTRRYLLEEFRLVYEGN